jgi:hypothetical protein
MTTVAATLTVNMRYRPTEAQRKARLISVMKPVALAEVMGGNTTLFFVKCRYSPPSEEIFTVCSMFSLWRRQAAVVTLIGEWFRQIDSLRRVRSKPDQARTRKDWDIRSCHENLALAKRKSGGHSARVQAAVAARHFCNASPLRTRSMLRETRWR